MRRVARLTIAMLLGVAVGALPVMLDRCTETCEAHRADASAPACHHTTSAAIHLTSAPAPCGHDHHGTTLNAPKGFSPPDRTCACAAVAVGQLLIAPPTASDVQVRPPAPPDISPSLASRSLPLRV
jgi:hypothetical protein